MVSFATHVLVTERGWFFLMETISALKGQFTRRKKELKVGLSLLKSKKDIEITDQYCGGPAILR